MHHVFTLASQWKKRTADREIRETVEKKLPDESGEKEVFGKETEYFSAHRIPKDYEFQGKELFGLYCTQIKRNSAQIN